MRISKILKLIIIIAIQIATCKSFGQLINDPTDITNLQLWLDAGDPNGNGSIPLDNTAINTWQDKSGQDNDATVLGGQGPASFRSSPALEINGNPVMEFTSNNNSLGDIYNVSGLDIRPNANPDITVFVVYRAKNPSNTYNNALWGVDNMNWDRFFYIYFSTYGDGINDGIVGLGPGDQAALVQGAAVPNRTRLLSVVYDGDVSGGANNGPLNSSIVRFGGTIVTNFTDTTHPTDQQPSLNIGWDGDDGAGDFYLAEFIVYNRLLTDCETSQVVDYLSIKYGEAFSQTITSQPVDTHVCQPDDAQFSVGVQGTVASYQWQEDNGSGTFTNIVNGGIYTGADTSDLVLTNPPLTHSGYRYRVEVTKPDGCISVSNPATLTVGPTDPVVTLNATQSFCDIDNATIADLQVTGTNITWYDAATGGNTMDPATTLTHNTIYYATQTVDGCESTPRLGVTANVFETIVPPATIPAMRLCDDDSDSDDTNGLLEFNLRNNEITIANGATVSDFNFRYFRDALRTDEILTPSSYVNELAFGSPQVIYVRAENQLFTNCSTDVEFEIEVYELPVITSSVSLTQCDTDTDGQTPFNLTEANELISTDHSNETFTYYTSPTDAFAGGSAGSITDTTLPVNPDTQYINPNPFLGSFVYARVENINGCSRVAEVELLVGASNIPSTFHRFYETCDTKEIDNDDTNGVATFNFSQAEADIEALFSQNVTVTFYTSLADALAEINQIDPSNHRNSLSPDSQNIYVRVDSNVVNACEGLGHFVTLTVNPLPLTNTVANYPLCSDNTTANFQLATKDVEVIAGQTTPILVTYHETLAEAQDPVGFPSGLDKNSYLSGARTIFVRAAFDDNNDGIHDPLEECFNTDMQFDLVVNQNPIVTTPLEPIRRCSEQTDTFFDLREKEAEMSLGDASIVFDYYETQADLNNNTPIPDYTNYLNTTLNNTIYVLATGTNACTSETTLELETTLYANLDLNPLPIEECEVDNDGYDFFDITRREDDILNGLDRNDFEFHYYISETDANEVSLNPNFISDRFNFENTTRRTQTIYVRVTPVANACFRVIPIQLIVNPVPEIAIEPEYVICLSPIDVSIPAVLTTTLPNPPIDTHLDPADYTFQWFDSNNVAIPGETGSTFVPVQTGSYTVIATNILTGCTIPATTEVFGSYPPESITVALLTDAFSKNNIIEVTVEGNGSYEFRLDTGDWQDSPVFERVNGGEHAVYVRDLLSCNSISEVINVIDFPKFFTPNDDGYNDNWNIEALRSQPNSVIYIYDRYGKLLKQIRPFGNGWDGTFNGSLMPSSDYWFVVAYTEPRTGTSKMFRAHFTLKR